MELQVTMLNSLENCQRLKPFVSLTLSPSAKNRELNVQGTSLVAN
jgi:hypothetical protein